VAGVVRQADQGELERGQLMQQRLRQLQAFAPRRLNVLGDGQRAEQGAVLEQHSLARLQGVALRLAEPPDVVPEHLDFAALRPQQPENVAQQDRLARAGAADHA
jgi:hypothetical protein